MIRTCTSCGQQNRVPGARLLDGGRCGACKSPLPAIDQPLDVDEAEFLEITQSVKVPVLVDFWAEWCGPCRMAAPEVSRTARNVAGRAVVLKVNTEQQPGLANRFAVRGIPHFAVLKGGELVFQQSGLVDHRQMQRWLEAAGA